MLEKVIENWTSRLDYIRASRGSPMPEIIFKISFADPTPLAHADTSRDVFPRGGTSQGDSEKVAWASQIWISDVG
ncbi:hypothetical protein TNCV_3461871 [Trichonephila clavipes]|nr:hypothetical protein TNCV_3461871 [Trichonephila clavipes]